jgi:hypothetical protein
MKKIICVFAVLLSFYSLSAQQNKQIHILRNDGGKNIIPQSEVDSITFSNMDIEGNVSDFWNTQILYTKNKEYFIPIKSIDNVMLNMTNGSVDQLFYGVEPMPEKSEWDSLMVTSNGYCSVIKTDSNEVVTIAIDAIGSIDNSNSIIAQFNPDLTPIFLIADNKSYHFTNYRESIVDIIIVENGEITLRTDVIYNQESSNARRREGVSQNHYADVVSKTYSLVNIAQGGVQGKAAATMTGIEIATQNGTSANGQFVISLSGVAVGAGAAIVAGLSWPAVVAGALIGGSISVWKYLEDKFNEEKIQSYRFLLGNCEVETLDPQRVDDKSYRIGVKVKNSNTIPSAYKGFHTYGLIIKKIPHGNVFNFSAFNIYDKNTQVIYQQRIANDGDYFVTLQDLELDAGYKYFCRAFILPYGESVSYEIGKGSAYSSFAYYGTVKEFADLFYARIIDYSQKSVTYNSGKLNFSVDVTAQFNNTKGINSVNDISGWGVCLYKDGELVQGKDYPINLSQTEGTVTIEFEAEKESMANDFSNFIATTKNHWAVGTYVDYRGAEYYARDRSEELIPLDLTYDEKPSITIKDVWSTGTEPYTEENEQGWDTEGYYTYTYEISGSFFIDKLYHSSFGTSWYTQFGFEISDDVKDGSSDFSWGVIYTAGVNYPSTYYGVYGTTPNGNTIMPNNYIQFLGDTNYVIVNSIGSSSRAKSRQNDIHDLPLPMNVPITDK